MAARWIGFGLVLAGMGCNPERSLTDVLTGKSCREDKPQCVEPYVCNEQHVCVLPFELPDAGGSSGRESGNLSPAGAGGAPQEVSTTGDPVVGRESGAAGSESVAAGTAGASSIDPGIDPDMSEVDAGCTKVELFRDLDGDGYGSGPSEIKCPELGWVTRGDDCFDAAPTQANRAALVHPEQTEFFLDGYPLPGQPGEVSFDYDCSLKEDPDPENSGASAAGDCGAATASCLAAIGIVPTDRSGIGVNNLCGSTTIQLCVPQVNGCAVGPSMTTEFKCR